MKENDMKWDSTLAAQMYQAIVQDILTIIRDKNVPNDQKLNKIEMKIVRLFGET